jgi:N-acetylneuraminate synthase
MNGLVNIGDSSVGNGRVYVIAEIGINHNGDLEIAKKLIDVASFCGCDAVKFQKRTPDVCVPEHQKSMIRETPWGEMTYLEYRYKVEFEEAEYAEIDRYCREKGIAWSASPWDVPSAEFLDAFDVPFIKIASAMLTNDELVCQCAATGKPVIMSTGMSTMDEVRHAFSLLDPENSVLLHCTSTYPSQPIDVNLRVMSTLRDEFDCPVGYSGHETGLQISLAAVALGASALERHITLDRAMWGSDHAASLEPGGLGRLVRDVRVIEAASGDGEKTVSVGELKMRERLRPAVA